MEERENQVVKAKLVEKKERKVVKADSYDIQFILELNHLMKNPLDRKIERRFAAMLLTANLDALVKIKQNTINVLHPDAPRLNLSLAVVTYLADGRQYIPVFTDYLAIGKFFNDLVPDVQFSSQSFTTAELMTEVEQLDLAGILVNPGKQTFPLTLDYWQYINKVVPLINVSAQKKLEISLPQPKPNKLLDALTRYFHKHRIFTRAWLTEISSPEHTHQELTLIIDHSGSQREFEEKFSRKIAAISHPYLDYGQAISIGDLADDVGINIEKQIEPFFVRKKTFFW